MKYNEKYDKYDNLRQDMDTHDNTMELIIDSKSENESFARVVVASFVARLDPTLEEIADIKTAVSEAVTNCIIHGTYVYNETAIGTFWNGIFLYGGIYG